MKQTARKTLALILSMVLLCGLCAPSAFAAESVYSDTQGHWAEEAIARWSGYGIIGGYGGGLFGPDDSITRAQMATILSKTLGLTETAENPFADVPTDAWYTPYILRCYAAGIMLGDGTNANPDAVITRQAAMTMLCRAFAIAPAESADLSVFTDGRDTADWAAPFVAALVDSGIVGGIGGGLLSPLGSMTRAAVVTVIDRTVDRYITTSGEYELGNSDGLVLVTAGDVILTGKTDADILITSAADGKTVTFDKATVTGSITVQADNAIVNVKNSTLPAITMTGEGSKVNENKPISGSGGGYVPSVPSGSSALTITEDKTVSGGTYRDVTITDAVGDGEVTLTGLTIQGDLTIKGGGSNSIKLIDCTISGKVIMAKEGGEAPRLHLTNTPISSVEVQKPAIIEAADETSAVAAVEAKAAVEVKGENTTISSITVPAETESAVSITVTAGSVETVEAKSETTVSGAGTVCTVVAEAPVFVASEIVEKVEVPATAPADVAVSVTGSESVDVAVNSDKGVSITTSGMASVEVSTEQETAPEITVNGTQTHAHKWNGGEITTAATCEGEGVKTYGCTADGCSETKTESIPVLGHQYGNWTKDDDTNHKRVCANDGAHVETAPHGWDSGVETTAPTCEGEGVKTYTCSVCTGTKTEPITAINHNWGDWTKVDDTNHKRVCANDTAHTETAPHGWDGGVITTEPTESTEGVKTYTCSDCGATKTESVPVVVPASVSWVSTGKFGWTSVDGAARYRVSVYEGEKAEGTAVLTRTPTATSYNMQNIVMTLAGESDVTYSVKVEALDSSNNVLSEVGAIDSAIVVTVAGTAPEFAFTVDEDNKTYTMTFAEGTPDGPRTMFWTSADETSEYNILNEYTTLTSTYTRTNEFASGDTVSLRIFSANNLNADSTAWCVTLTPTSTQTYKTEPFWFTTNMYGTQLYLNWEAAELASGERYYVIGNNPTSATSYTLTPFMRDTLTVIEESKSVPVTVYTGTSNSNKVELYTSENAVIVTVSETAPEVSVVGQADGTYKIVSNSYNGKYLLVFKNPDGDIIWSNLSTNGSMNISPWEGCTVEVRTIAWTISDDTNSVEFVLSPITTVSEITLCVAPSEVTEVATYDELLAALKIGGTVRMTADISTTNTLTLNTGADATLELNGHALDIPELATYYGKHLTIDGSVEGSKICCSSGTNTLMATVHSYLTITGGGEYQNVTNDNSVVVISGGTFTVDPTAFVDTTNYAITANADAGTWTVTPNSN